MASMIPDEPGANASLQERRLFQRLARELPSDCVVLHSLGLPRHPSKLWGEGDFVVLTRSGVFVLEEKGGGVSCKDGVWTYSRRADGISNTSREGPFNQASSAMFAVRDEIKNHLPGYRDLLFGFGVLMPDEKFDATGCEIEPEVMLDQRDYATTRMDVYIARLSEFWTNKYQQTRDGHLPRPLQKKDVEAIQQVLRPDVVSVFTLNSVLCQAEKEQVRLTSEQLRVLRGMEGNPRTLIRGAAGTGKTLLALDTARRYATPGSEPVLLLCFNRLLAQHLCAVVAQRLGQLPIHVRYIHDWFRSLIKEAKMLGRLREAPESDASFYTEHFASVASDAIVEVAPEPYGCVVMDEAQDILRAPFLDAVDLVLSGGLRHGHWHIFLDPQQRIYTDVDESELTRLLSYGAVQYPLRVNCRNTERVATQTSIVSAIDVALESATEGGFADVEFVDSPAHAVERLERKLERLRSDGVPRNEMIILSTRKLPNSCLAGVGRIAGMRIRDLTADDKAGGECIDFCTMHSFKGLERRVVLAVDLEQLDEPRSRLLHYCGLSRARTGLIAFIDRKEEGTFQQFAIDFGRRRAERADDGGVAITAL